MLYCLVLHMYHIYQVERSIGMIARMLSTFYSLHQSIMSFYTMSMVCRVHMWVCAMWECLRVTYGDQLQSRTFHPNGLEWRLKTVPGLRLVDGGQQRQDSPGYFSSFIIIVHQGHCVTYNFFHSFLPLCSGTAQHQQPVDSGLLSPAGWHLGLQGDLTVGDRQNCFQCTPKEALSKANIDFGGVFFFSLCLLPGASK